MRAATVIETPPLLVCGIRAYAKTPYGLRNVGEVWMQDPPADLERALILPEKFNTEQMLAKLSDSLATTDFVRLITATQPKGTGLARKKPDISLIVLEKGNSTIT
jgi:large subunit ribosomal protein L3